MRPLLRALGIAGAGVIVVAVVWVLMEDVRGSRSGSASSTRSSSSPAEDEGVWGPLAVERSGVGMDAAISGRLEITDECVVLIAVPDFEILLVWPADRTTWDDELRTVTFIDEDASVFTLRDGMSVRFGGGGFSEAESDISTAEWLENWTWVNEPDTSCIGSEAWLIDNVMEAE